MSSLEADLGERDAKVSSLEADLAAKDDRIQELSIAEAFARNNAISVEKVSELEEALKLQEQKIKKLEGELEETREDRGGVEYVMGSLTDEERAEAETAFEALNNADVWEDARGDSPYSRRSVNASINSMQSSPLPALSELAGSRLGRVVSKIMRDAARKAREQVEKKEEERQELVLQLLEAKGVAEQVSVTYVSRCIRLYLLMMCPTTLAGLWPRLFDSRARPILCKLLGPDDALGMHIPNDLY